MMGRTKGVKHTKVRKDKGLPRELYNGVTPKYVDYQKPQPKKTRWTDDIIQYLKESPLTHAELGRKYGVSRSRIQQIRGKNSELIRHWKPVPKPDYKRNKPTAKERGAISPEVYEKAMDRAELKCERCGWPNMAQDDRKWRLEAAHLVKRHNLPGTTENDIAMLCGPSVNTGTCHNWVDYTAEGKEWASNFRRKLYELLSDRS